MKGARYQLGPMQLDFHGEHEVQATWIVLFDSRMLYPMLAPESEDYLITWVRWGLYPNLCSTSLVHPNERIEVMVRRMVPGPGSVMVSCFLESRV